MKFRIIILAFVALCICFTSVSVVEAKASSSITVSLANSEDNICIKNAEVTLYKIAEFTDYQKRKYVIEKKYKDIVSKIDFSTTEKSCTRENAKVILDFIKNKNISDSVTKRTDESGKVQFNHLTEGIYLVDVSADKKFKVDAFIIEVPMTEEGIYTNDITATPKIEVNSGEIVSTGIVETAKQGKDREKIPQTGQVKWPVPVLFVLGISFIAVGYADYCFKERKKNEDEQK